MMGASPAKPLGTAVNRIDRLGLADDPEIPRRQRTARPPLEIIHADGYLWDKNYPRKERVP
jgi:hypothetical protein